MNLASTEFATDKLYADLLGFVRQAAPRQRLASARALAQEYGISHTSVMHVIDRLVAAGLVKKEHGKGCFVTPRVQRTSARTVLFVTTAQATALSYYFRIWQGVAQTLDAEGFRAQMLLLGLNGASLEKALSDEFSAGPVASDIAGLVIPWLTTDMAALIEALHPGLPVLISQSLEADQDYCAVLRDFRDLGYQSMRYLVQQGAKRPAVVYRGAPYWDGVSQARDEAGRALDLVPMIFPRPPQPAAIANRLLQEDVDSVAFSEDKTAVPVLHELLARDGDFLRRVPVVSHANKSENILPPSVAKLEHDGFERGVLTARTLLDLIDGRITTPVAIYTKPRLIPPLPAGESPEEAPHATH